MKFESIDASKFQSLENKEMGKLLGGRSISGGDCTLDTITIYASGKDAENDGNDDWDGECSGSLPKE